MPSRLPSARQFAASIDLVPRQHGTGGKPTLLGKGLPLMKRYSRMEP